MPYRKVQFLKDTKSACLDGLPDQGVFIVYREGFGYGIPERQGAVAMDIERFRAVYDGLDISHVVFVGLNRIITPSNRCEFIYSFLSTATPNIPKTSIDTSPFIGEPWRLFFHYLFTRSGNWTHPHSYALETEWKKWFFREINTCCMAQDNVRLLIGQGTTCSDLPSKFMSVVWQSAEDVDLKWYAEVRELVFAAHNTPKMWIAGLLRECNKRFGLAFGFDSYLDDRAVELPDLPVYRFVAEEAQRRVGIYNAAVEAGR